MVGLLVGTRGRRGPAAAKRGVTLVLAGLLAVGLAGCLSQDATLAGSWRLDCSLADAEAGPWAQSCLGRASHTVGGKQEIWLAVNPTDPNNVVLGSKDNNPESSANCVWNGVHVTLDGGRTWSDVVIGGRYHDRTPDSPYWGYACNTDPMFAFAPDGTLHYNVEMYNVLGRDGFGPLGPGPESERGILQPGWKSVLATSHDGGLTWPDAVTWVVGDGAASIPDYSRMTVMPDGAVILMINSFDNSGFGLGAVGLADMVYGAGYDDVNYCYILRSLDGGATAEPPIALTTSDAPLAPYCWTIEASPDGALALGWGGAFGQANETLAQWSTSYDVGETWSAARPGYSYQPIPPVFEENAFRTGVNYEAAFAHAGPWTGRLYAIHAQQDGVDADILIRWSDNEGVTWSPPVQVDEAPRGDQWLPNVAVAGDGSVHVAFLDKSRDPDNRLIDVVHAASLDGGETWHSGRVTRVNWDGDLGVHQEGFPFLGDYIGLDAAGSHVWGGVPDGSNGAALVAAAFHVSG